jgi:DNA invertase Pin-like site-specific DNA recombinase
MDSAGYLDALGNRSGPITPQHLQRLAIVYVRQSTPGQVRENTGSTAAQRDLRLVAQQLGWAESRVRTIEDLGRSGTSTSGRQGYLELMALMDRNEVGIVLVQEQSRLGRKRSDSAAFLELAEETGTLVYSHGAVHDPASGDLAATLGLEMAGTFATHESRVRIYRMREAKVAKAQRGQAVSAPPIGYLRTPEGGWTKDPDRSVQDAILRVFDLYPKLGSLGKIVRYFREHGLEFPRRTRGQLRWGPIDAALLHAVLHNPAYCGDYVVFRRQTKRRSDGVGVIVKFRPPSQWIETRDHHAAYLSREAWQRIQDLLASRRPKLRPLVGKGKALFQGLLRCAVDGCGRRMKTQYWGREGVARTATYTCLRQNGWGDATHQVTVPARYVDHALVEHVLAALIALDTDTARAVIERSQRDSATLERAQRRRLLDAEEDVEKLLQLLKNVPPELQSAHADLWAKYNAAVQRGLELKTQLAMETVPSLSITTADIGELITLTGNIRQLWAAPQRTNAEKKELLQTLIAEVIVHRADREGADLEILWKDGSRQPLRVYRASGVEAFVADRTRQGKNSQAIADELNAAGAVTASGQPISPQLVAQKQGRRGLRLKDERRRARQLIRQGLVENRPRREILSQLETEVPRLGPWTPQRLSDYIRQLRQEDAAERERLPTVLPAEQEKQRVLAFTEQALGAGQTWKAIAVSLNQAGFRPPRGRAFTPVQVRLLYLRAHGLSSFKLAARSNPTAPGA